LSYGAAMARKKTLDDILDEYPIGYDELADSCGIARYTLWRIRKGETEKPRRQTLHALAEGLELTFGEVRAAARASYDLAQKG